MHKTSKIFIAGYTGLVGSAIMRKLRAEGYNNAKLACEKRWEDIDKDEKVFGPIPDEVKISLGLDPSTGRPVKPSNKKPRVILWGSGTPKREFLHVDDLAGACVFLMNNYDSNEIINIGMGKDHTIREIAQKITEEIDFKYSVTFDTSMQDGMPQKLLDTSKIKSIGWKPNITLEQGICKTYAWYKQKLQN